MSEVFGRHGYLWRSRDLASVIKYDGEEQMNWGDGLVLVTFICI